MIDKDFCLSSYIAYRYICKPDVDFYEGMHHELFTPVAMSERIPVGTAQEIDQMIQRQFDALYAKYESIGILLSGGMDSAILAAYLRKGSHAYTFTAQGTEVFNADEQRARHYCEKFGLVHHFVDISMDDYRQLTPTVMKAKCAPVHSIEPQIYKAAMAAKRDGVELMIVGESSDLIFGGMDQLLSKDWLFDDFVRRYTFLDPQMVLTHPVDVSGLFEKYRRGEHIDFMTFMDEVFSIESSSSYLNAFGVAGMPYYDPYANLVMRDELDLERVRSGEPKYLIRNLYAIKYPEVPIPDKIPMPRPVDKVFKEWGGPQREEFRNDIPMQQLTGNQKWQLWCAEQFLQMNEPK
ncbi:MAG: hypothetical protein IJ604_12730 [Prevotella sp.]|nr:hypothetical protein [Prevotella sp.]